MKRKNRYVGWTVIAGAIGFVFIVVFLHIVQPDYDLMNQQMSELALGKYGFLMFFAFCSFAFAVFSVLMGLKQHKPPAIIRVFLAIAAVSLFGAGLFRLDNATNLHITLVAISFVLIVVVMYLLPRHVGAFKTSADKITSWSLATATAACVALSQNLVPLGIGQRGAALFILVWLVWIGIKYMQLKRTE
jgi:hypothetical protein